MFNVFGGLGLGCLGALGYRVYCLGSLGALGLGLLGALGLGDLGCLGDSKKQGSLLCGLSNTLRPRFGAFSPWGLGGLDRARSAVEAGLTGSP